MSRLLELYREREDARSLLAKMQDRVQEHSDDEASPSHRVKRAIEDVKSRIKEIEEEIEHERDRASGSPD